MKVHELTSNLASRADAQRYRVTLGDIDIADDAASMTVSGSEFLLDDQTVVQLARYLKIPGPYLKACPPQFRADTLRFWRDRHSAADTVVETLGNEIVSIHSTNLKMIPLDEIGDMIDRVFSPTDEVVTLIRNTETFHVDVISPDYVAEVLNPQGMPGRPDVGDLTFGGVRILAWPNKVKAPVVSTFLHRSAFNTGVVSDLKSGMVTIKGRTTDDVLDEMECAAERIMGKSVEEALTEYAKTAEVMAPGSPLAFATQLCREASLPVRVRGAVVDGVNQLPSSASVYDVIQVFAQVAESVKYGTKLALQELAGTLSFDTSNVIRRCSTCEQLLVAS